MDFKESLVGGKKGKTQILGCLQNRSSGIEYSSFADGAVPLTLVRHESGQFIFKLGQLFLDVIQFEFEELFLGKRTKKALCFVEDFLSNNGLVGEVGADLLLG